MDHHPGNWVFALAAGELRADDVVGIVAAGHDIAIYSVGGAVYATSNVCTHGQARLCDGFLVDHEIECPWHQGRFDVRNGQPTCGPATEAVRSYPVRIDEQGVYVQID
jgi:naphthalene 1,2-dioxygenase system ferredoxin subunit